jgi:hypothetical protein
VSITCTTATAITPTITDTTKNVQHYRVGENLPARCRRPWEMRHLLLEE